MIPLRYMLAAMAAIVILTAGCGADSTPTPKPAIPAYTAKSSLYHVETVTLDGRALTCLVRLSGTNGDAISCDWVAYHEDGNGEPVGFRP